MTDQVLVLVWAKEERFAMRPVFPIKHSVEKEALPAIVRYTTYAASKTSGLRAPLDVRDGVFEIRLVLKPEVERARVPFCFFRSKPE